jgi:hypothetical protein
MGSTGFNDSSLGSGGGTYEVQASSTKSIEIIPILKKGGIGQHSVDNIAPMQMSPFKRNETLSCEVSNEGFSEEKKRGRVQDDLVRPIQLQKKDY